MKKMRKMVSLALTAAMTAGLMTGMGALTASADSERTKITALLKRNGINRAVSDL